MVYTHDLLELENFMIPFDTYVIFFAFVKFGEVKHKYKYKLEEYTSNSFLSNRATFKIGAEVKCFLLISALLVTHPKMVLVSGLVSKSGDR